MELNKLNVCSISENKINGDVRGGTIYCFFPIKWEIEWSFDSGETGEYTDVYTRDTSIIFSFDNVRPTVSPYPIDTSGKIFAKSVKYGETQLEGCVHEYFVQQGDGSYIEIELRQDDGDGNGVIDSKATFKASGTVTLISDHYNDSYFNSKKTGQEEINALEGINEFPGTVRIILPDDGDSTPKFPDAKWDYTIKRLEA